MATMTNPEIFARRIIKTLQNAGFEALFAGGCVRDMLLHKKPEDYDIATSALPNQVRSLFGHRRTLAIGLAFGVIEILGSKQTGNVQVATFRSDDSYTDGRHPDRVVFSSAVADAQRRDFTINGMFYDPVKEQFFDYVGGQRDLKLKMIRAIGNPNTRFQEDRLRLLRAIRFSTRFGFELEATTKTAIIEKCVMDYLDANIDKLEKRKEKIFTKSNQYYDILEKRRRELFIEAKQTMDGGKNFS